MPVRLLWKRAFLIAAITSCLLWRGTAMAQLSATLSANPVDYKGRCPTVITFTGVITSARATRVTYVFIRSDGAIDTDPKTVDFNQPGSRAVTTTWTLGGNTLSAYSGWEAIKIINPGTVKSNEAKFRLHCTTVALSPGHGFPPGGGPGRKPAIAYNICSQHPEVCHGVCTVPGCLLQYPIYNYCDPDGCPECPDPCTITLTFEDLDPDLWTVEVIDPAGGPVAVQQVREEGTVVVRFQPKAEFTRVIGEYSAGLRGARRGIGFDMKPRLGVSRVGQVFPQACQEIAMEIGQLIKAIQSASNQDTRDALEKQLAELESLYARVCGAGQAISAK